ncbi:MAG: beta strand repeat-containing protein [Chthoniobacterales bacterium]
MCLLAGAAAAATITVTTNGDDATPNDGSVSLREAISAINAGNNLGDPNIIAQNSGTFGTNDRINFNIPGSGVHTIAVASGGLPKISKPMTIDGYTQPGASVNTVAVGDNAVLLIELNGAGAGSSGFTLGGTNGGSTIRGLVINRFVGQFEDAAINVVSGNNVVVGCFIGVDPAGNTKLANGGGVRVGTGANSVIGRATPADRNIISGNNASTNSSGGSANVAVTFNGGSPPSVPFPTGTVIANNYIGTNAAGTTAVSDLSMFGATDGILLTGGTGTLIGGADAADGATDGNIGARNVISGNLVGISTRFGFNNGGDVTVQGNFIGVNAAGTAPVGNYMEGINFTPAPPASNSITIGGTAAGAGNVISGTIYGSGIYTNARTILIQGNLIGTDPSGKLDFGNASSNGGAGIQLVSPFPSYPDSQVTIGGPTAAARNVISGNGGAGISYQEFRTDTRITRIQGNFIGTQSDGVSPLGNDGFGIYAFGPMRIGGTNSGEGNVIAYNGVAPNRGAGIVVPYGLSGTGPFGITILGNSIFGNRGLGIDLGGQFDSAGDGPTPNDTGDADAGPNGLQNFPLLTSTRASVGGITVKGSLNSLSNTTYRIEFFGNTEVDPTFYGEGRAYLGFINVTTDANGNASFDAPIPGAALITSTATDPAGNTSEFSQSIGQLLNISTRLRVRTGENVLIGGFIIVGTDPKKVVVRAIGPSLSAFGIPDPLQDPVLELHDGVGAIIATNDNWKINDQTGQSQQAEIEATHLAPTNDAESALVKTLPSANAAYTAIVRGTNETTGIAVVEGYDADPAANSRFANISTRGFVETGTNVLIGGFIVGNGTSKVIVRATGPSLTNYGIVGALQDPALEVHNGNGTTISTNDNWKLNDQTGQSQETDIRATGLAPTSDPESAIVATLPPGPYTAIVRGKNETTGIGVVEVYALP